MKLVSQCDYRLIKTHHNNEELPNESQRIITSKEKSHTNKIAIIYPPPSQII